MTKNQRASVEELHKSARLKMSQLESEIRACTASTAAKSNMLHTLSKLSMFSGDAVEMALREDRSALPLPVPIDEKATDREVERARRELA